MIRIRLSRHGARNNPFYKVVAIDQDNRREGMPLEELGYWHPATDDKKINLEGIKAWQGKGAVISDAVAKLIATK